jgi:hypothetical protein
MINKVFNDRNHKAKNKMPKDLLSKRSFGDSDLNKEFALEDLNSEIMSSKTFQLKKELKSELESKKITKNSKHTNLAANSGVVGYSKQGKTNTDSSVINNTLGFFSQAPFRNPETSFAQTVNPNSKSNNTLAQQFPVPNNMNYFNNSQITKKPNMHQNILDSRYQLSQPRVNQQQQPTDSQQPYEIYPLPPNFNQIPLDESFPQQSQVFNQQYQRQAAHPQNPSPYQDEIFKPQVSQIPRRNIWESIGQPLNQTIQINLHQKSFTEQISKLRLNEIGDSSYPIEIKNEIKRLEQNRIEYKRRDFEEVFVSTITCQNKIYFWDFEKNIFNSIKMPSVVSSVNLLKIVNQQTFFWVQTDHNLGYVVSVLSFMSQANSFEMEVVREKSSFKAVDASCFKYIAKGNYLVFVSANKWMGSVYFNEVHKKVRIKGFDYLTVKQQGGLKRIKKAVTSLFASKKYYEFKVRVFEDKLYVMKTTWQADSNGQQYMQQHPLWSKISSIDTDKKVSPRSQNISSFRILPMGDLEPQGKLKISQLYQTNRAFLNTSFYQIGGFDFSSKIIDFHIKPISKNKIISNLLEQNHKQSSLNSIDILSDLNEDLFKINENPNPEIAGLLSQNIVLLLENGIEIEVQPFDSMLKSLTTFNLVDETQNEDGMISGAGNGMSLLGYFAEGEILGLKNDKLYMLFR